jgi:hypothetical protein
MSSPAEEPKLSQEGTCLIKSLTIKYVLDQPVLWKLILPSIKHLSICIQLPIDLTIHPRQCLKLYI